MNESASTVGTPSLASRSATRQTRLARLAGRAGLVAVLLLTALVSSAPLASAATDTTKPSRPVVDAPSSTGSSVTMSWRESADDVGVTGYVVTLVGIEEVTVHPHVRSYTFGGLEPGQYTVHARAIDAVGNRSLASAARFNVLTPAEFAATRTGLAEITDALEEFVHHGGSLTDVGGNGGRGYFNYQGGNHPTKISTTLIEAGFLSADYESVHYAKYLIYHCGSGTSLRAGVFAELSSGGQLAPQDVINWGECSVPSHPHTFFTTTPTVEEMQAPRPFAIPQWLDPVRVTPPTGPAEFLVTNWEGVSGAWGYDLEYRLDGTLRSVGQLEDVDDQPEYSQRRDISEMNGEWCVRVRASATHWSLHSPWSSPQCIEVGVRDVTPPSRPGWGPRYASIDANHAAISWTASTDDTRVSGYSVTLTGADDRRTFLTSNTRSYKFLDVAVGWHQISVQARDVAGNDGPTLSAWVKIATAADHATARSDVGLIADAIDAFIADGGEFADLGGSQGQGWFNFSNGSSYPTKISQTLIDGGYLDTRFGSVHAQDYMVYRCGTGDGQRAGVFAFNPASRAPAADDVANWEGCPTNAFTYAHHYYATTGTRADLQTQQLPTPEFTQAIKTQMTDQQLRSVYTYFTTSPDAASYSVEWTLDGVVKHTSTIAQASTKRLAYVRVESEFGEWCIRVRSNGSGRFIASEWAEICSAVVRPPPPADVTRPSSVTPRAESSNADSVTISWPGATDNVAVVGYEIVVDGETVHAVDATERSAQVAGLWANQHYEVGVRATDAAGNRATLRPITMATWDRAPSAPEVALVTWNTHSLTFRWTEALDDVGVASYQPVLNGVPGPRLSATKRSYTFENLAAYTTYGYSVIAHDDAGHSTESLVWRKNLDFDDGTRPAGAPIGGPTDPNDTTPPVWNPNHQFIVVNSFPDKVEISWTGQTDYDNYGSLKNPAGYELYVDGSLDQTITHGEFSNARDGFNSPITISGLTEGQTARVMIVPVDDAGNVALLGLTGTITAHGPGGSSASISQSLEAVPREVVESSGGGGGRAGDDVSGAEPSSLTCNTNGGQGWTTPTGNGSVDRSFWCRLDTTNFRIYWAAKGETRPEGQPQAIATMASNLEGLWHGMVARYGVAPAKRDGGKLPVAVMLLPSGTAGRASHVQRGFVLDTDDEYRFRTLTHELFHMIQYEAFGIDSGADKPAQGWLEGAAEAAECRELTPAKADACMFFERPGYRLSPFADIFLGDPFLTTGLTAAQLEKRPYDGQYFYSRFEAEFGARSTDNLLMQGPNSPAWLDNFLRTQGRLMWLHDFKRSFGQFYSQSAADGSVHSLRGIGASAHFDIPADKTRARVTANAGAYIAVSAVGCEPGRPSTTIGGEILIDLGNCGGSDTLVVSTLRHRAANGNIVGITVTFE